MKKFVLVFLAACSGRAEPAASSDSPIAGGQPTSDYPEAVLLGMENSGACTGTLIAPRVVLTAGHCVNGFTQWEVRLPNVPPYDESPVQAAWATAAGTYDVGVVVLSDPITLEGYPNMVLARTGQRVVAVGRVTDGQFPHAAIASGVVQLRTSSSSSQRYPQYMQLSRAVGERGDSGGGVFLEGAHTLVAVLSNSNRDPRAGLVATLVVPITDELWAWIDERVRENGGY